MRNVQPGGARIRKTKFSERYPNPGPGYSNKNFVDTHVVCYLLLVISK